MKRIISIAILFLLVGVGYVHADVIYKGDLNFAVSNIEEKPYGTPVPNWRKLVTTSERVIGHIYVVMDDLQEQLLYIEFGMKDDLGVEHIIIHIDGANAAVISDDIMNAKSCKLKIVGYGPFTAPDTGLGGIAYIALNATAYYPDGFNVTKIVITSGSKVGGGSSVPGETPYIFSGTLNSSTLTTTHPD